MKPEIKKKWLKALRSGLYGQCKSSLCKPTNRGYDEFCCLGVLCDLHAIETGGHWTEWGGELAYKTKLTESFFGYPNSVSGYVPVTNFLPDAVRRWSGLRSKKIQDSLAELNDSGVSFEDIADWIEENL